MGRNAFPARTTVPDKVEHEIRLLGVNGADPTKEYGPGVTVTRTGEGAYLITWAESPGTFVGWSCSFGAATPADLKGYTAVRDTYDTSAFTLAFVTYDSTFTAADIIANQYADVRVTFKATAV